MKRIFAGLVVIAGLSMAAAPLRADNRATPKGPDEDGTKPALARIAGEGMMNSHAFEFLTELSDDIGGRVTGTPAERKAEEWGAAKMKSIGLENVHTEKYTIWRGWTRGAAEGEILAPVRHKLHVDAMGWTGSTPAGGAEGDVVPVNLFDIDNEIKNAARLKGKIVLVVTKGNPPGDGMMLFARFGDFLKAAGPAGAIAVIGGQGGAKSTGMNLTHTGILGFNADFLFRFCPCPPRIRASWSVSWTAELLLACASTCRMRLPMGPWRLLTWLVKFAGGNIPKKSSS